MILVDTSALVRSLTGPRDALPQLEVLIEAGERLRLPTIVLYEWRRGPRTPEELAYQERLMPSEEALPLDASAALQAADLFVALGRPRSREIDLAIAGIALSQGAQLWTLDRDDFEDVPDLDLVASA